ncbi:3-phosphoshikimate 1-carboxyvinyltransferase [Piscibacillus salipiscarius]|uniref:3-phosphoshikimate 1-carboxyvinyltransferase n=1 Tax=Piscibacillus salipiscarius TaxID=299480 RepID=UPI0034E1C6E2
MYGKGVQGLSQPKDSVNMGNSGTTVRLISGILAALPFNTKLVGDQSLSHRPMDRIIEPLTEMGASIESSGGTLPMLIRGRPLTPIRYRLPVDSAQVKSAIMLAGLLTEGITTVLEQNTTRDHTERMLPIFGVEVNRNDQGIQLEGRQNLASSTIHVPGDVSSASFWVAGATITPGSHVTIKNVGLNPTRLGFINVLKRMGAQINTEVKRYEGDEPIGNISASYTERLTPTPLQKHEIATLVDEVPLLALVATQANGQMKMKHLEELRYKESDRIKNDCKYIKTIRSYDYRN